MQRERVIFVTVESIGGAQSVIPSRKAGDKVVRFLGSRAKKAYLTLQLIAFLVLPAHGRLTSAIL